MNLIKLISSIKEKEREKEEYKINLDRIKEKLKTAEDYLAENSKDSELETTLNVLEEKINTALVKHREIENSCSEKKEISESILKINNEYIAAENELKENREKLTEIEKLIEKNEKELAGILDGRNLKEYRTEKEHLLKQKNLVDIIFKLENERDKLEDGKPCPLCGSVEHPYAEGNIPDKDDIDKEIDYFEKIIQNAEKKEELIRKTAEDKAEAVKKLSVSEKNTAVITAEKKSAEKELISISEDIKNKEKYFDKLVNELSFVLENFGIKDFSIENASEITVLVKKRLENWKNFKYEKDKLEKEESLTKNEILNRETLIKNLSETLTGRNTEYESVFSELEKALSERKKIFGDKNPDTEENRIDKLKAEAENDLEMKRNAYNEALQKLNNIKSSIETLEKKTAAEKPVLEKMEKDFLENILQSGFENEISFIESRLGSSERDILSEKAKELVDREAEIKTGLKDREKRLEQERAELTGDMKQDQLEKEYEEYRKKHRLLIDEIAGIRHRLEENEAAGERLKEKQKEIEKQSAECLKWEKLHSYIGSADGKKYREFAQGITFEIMVSHANRQMEKMTDRYILLRSSESQLELNVADNYQAGEIRSVKNLSGGESFIVSLALALGLSKMAGRKVRVDSLFLDEGFGTLDEDALETALETLSSLQQDGKLIGVISHVNALKERITTQISVNPVSGGRSVIKGPGCKAAG